MTRDEALELLELMKRQQHDEDSVAPLDPEMLARAYVRMIARRRKNRGEQDRGDGPAGCDGACA